MDTEESGNYHPDVLTGIPSPYTLSATETGDTSEVDKLMVKHFLNTLAEIALAIASRKGDRK